MYFGISLQSFPTKVNSVLMAPVNEDDVEIKPDGQCTSDIHSTKKIKSDCSNFFLDLQTGMIYLPEIMYRRILNQAFGPGGWALMPRGDTLHYQVNNYNYDYYN